MAVNQYYFYLQDREWGQAFLKVGTYLPYPVKLCLNGHEWVKQRLRRDRIRFESLDNGFLSCAEPAALQAACDALGPADVQAFFDRWSHRLLWPMTPQDRAAGYDHRLAICSSRANGLGAKDFSPTSVHERPNTAQNQGTPETRGQLDEGDVRGIAQDSGACWLYAEPGRFPAQ